MADKSGAPEKLDVLEGANVSIIVVAASVKVQTHLVQLLGELEYQRVTTFFGGIEALRHLEENPVSIVICEARMNHMPGWEFVRELKTSERIPNIPVIFGGPKENEVPADELRKFGVLEYLAFPVTRSKLMFLMSSSLALAKTSGTIEHKFSKAKDALIKNASSQAVELYSELRTLTEKNVRSTVGLVQSYVKADDLVQAEAVMEDMAKDNGAVLTDAPSLLMQATFHLRRNEPDRARAVVDRMLKLMPDAPFNYVRCLRLFADTDQFVHTEHICKEALKRNFRLPDFHLGLAKCQYSGGWYDDAVKTVEDGIAAFGANNDFLNLKGVCCKKKGDFTAALVCYEQGLKLAPLDPKIYFNIANCYLAMKNYPEAQRYFEACLKISPGFVRAAAKLDELKNHQAAG